MKDRIVQYPHRYRIVPVAGEDGVYDLVPAPGMVTEVGTALNKGNLLSDATANVIGLEFDPSVDDALFKLASKPEPFNAYATDLYMYITGRHPILNAGPYGDYGPENRGIKLSGNAETIVVRDNNIWGVR